MGLISGPNWFEQQEARYHGFVNYTRIKNSVPIETTNPLYLTSGCSNQFGPKNRPPLKFNYRLGLFSGPNWFEQHVARYDGFVVYTRIKSSVPVETTNPLYLASGCSNQFGPENRPPENLILGRV